MDKLGRLLEVVGGGAFYGNGSGSYYPATYITATSAIKSKISEETNNRFQKLMSNFQNNIANGKTYQQAIEDLVTNPALAYAGNPKDPQMTVDNVVKNFMYSKGIDASKIYKQSNGMTTVDYKEIDKLSNLPQSAIGESGFVKKFIATQLKEKVNAIIASNSFKKLYAPSLSSHEEVRGFAFEHLLNNYGAYKKGVEKRYSLFDLMITDKNGQLTLNESLFKTKEDRNASLAKIKDGINSLRNGLINASTEIDPSLPNMTPATADAFIKKLNFAPSILSSIAFDPSNATSKIDADNGWGNNPDAAGAGLGKNNYSGSGKLSASAPRQVIVNIGNLMSIDTIKLLASEAGQSPEMQSLKAEMKTALLEILKDVSQDMYS